MLLQLIFLQLLIIVSTLDTNEYECDKSSSLQQMMRIGNWKCAKDIVITHNDKALDHKSLFDVEERTIMKEIAMLKQLIDTYQPANYINPAFQWAQSPSEILLNVKFAHKLDAPATLNVEANNVTITENGIMLLASNGRKNFKLELFFLKNIIPSESTYAMASVGRMTITLKKEHNLRWTRLTAGTSKLKHMHVWWDVVERWKKEVEKLPEVYKPPPIETETNDATPTLTESTSTSNNNNNDNTTTENNNSNDNSTNTELIDSSKTENSEEPKKILPQKTAEDEANEKYDIEISKLNQELKSQILSAEEEIRKRKKEIDLKAREEKTKLDAELAERKKLITNTIHDQKQSINISGSIASEL